MGGTSQISGRNTQTKQYYDRKIGAVNLKSGDLVLVKADAWKGKRKIKDYKVMNQHGRSRVLHQN